MKKFVDRQTHLSQSPLKKNYKLERLKPISAQRLLLVFAPVPETAVVGMPMKAIRRFFVSVIQGMNTRREDRRNMMRSFVWGVLACAAIFAATATAQMDFQFHAKGEIVAFAAEDFIPQDNGLPTASVRLAKVLIHNGTYEGETSIPLSELNRRTPLLKMHFKLYRGPKRLGIFTYEAVPEEKKIKKGEDYLRAIPVDKDAAIKALTANTTEQADILNLLNMTMDEATAAVKNESKLNEALAKAEADEIALLQKGKLDNKPLIFLPVSAEK
jgi:hypothetical protein